MESVLLKLFCCCCAGSSGLAFDGADYVASFEDLLSEHGSC